MKEFNTPLFRVLWGDGEAPCFYFGREYASLYLSLDPFLHTGWQSYPRPFFNKHGWRYYEGVLFMGHQSRNWSKIIRFPKVLIPLKPVDLWFKWKFRNFDTEEVTRKVQHD